ncbi:hypothetical protein HanRHA438_Chr15g0683851 [Helianthus annuus]|nr:hypothetical protein HanIR_Chr15g0729751 [Helianthus annuus]KAJ0842738.1 hypothetical protein HanRHA438_Chr15g0683851 [Helianthus annuus]
MDVDGGDRARPNNTKCAIITMVVVVCVFVVPLYFYDKFVILPLLNGPPDDANLLRVQISGRDFHTQHIKTTRSGA